MNRTHVLMTDDGGELEVTLGELQYTQDPEKLANMITLGVRSTCPTCSSRVGFPSRTTINPDLRTAAFAHNPNFLLAEQVAAFRYPKERSGELPKGLEQVNSLAFPITGRMRVAIDTMHAEVLLGLWLLTLSKELFSQGRFPYPLPSGKRSKPLRDRLNASMGEVAQRYGRPGNPGDKTEEPRSEGAAYLNAMPELFRLIEGSKTQVS